MADTPRLLWPAARGGSYRPVSVAEREKLGWRRAGLQRKQRCRTL